MIDEKGNIHTVQKTAVGKCPFCKVGYLDEYKVTKVVDKPDQIYEHIEFYLKCNHCGYKDEETPND